CYTVAREQRCQAPSAFGSDKIPDVGRDHADRGSRYIQLLCGHLIRRSRWSVLPEAVSSELSLEELSQPRVGQGTRFATDRARRIRQGYEAKACVFESPQSQGNIGVGRQSRK